MTRQEHLDWCKKRAHEYLDQGDIKNAITSMLSDLDKHKETKIHDAGTIAMLGLFTTIRGDIEAAARFIDGFR